jgi:hypothetical protein
MMIVSSSSSNSSTSSAISSTSSFISTTKTNEPSELSEHANKSLTVAGAAAAEALESDQQTNMLSHSNTLSNLQRDEEMNQSSESIDDQLLVSSLTTISNNEMPNRRSNTSNLSEESPDPFKKSQLGGSFKDNSYKVKLFFVNIFINHIH